MKASGMDPCPAHQARDLKLNSRNDFLILYDDISAATLAERLDSDQHIRVVCADYNKETNVMSKLETGSAPSRHRRDR